MLSGCVGVEDIESGPKATPNPERRRPDQSGWPRESFYYKGFAGCSVQDGHSCPSQLMQMLDAVVVLGRPEESTSSRPLESLRGLSGHKLLTQSTPKQIAEERGKFAASDLQVNESAQRFPPPKTFAHSLHPDGGRIEQSDSSPESQRQSAA